MQYGVVPFENSTHGPVIPTLELLVDRDAVFPDLVVEEEVRLPIRHCLIGKLHDIQANSITVASDACQPLETGVEQQINEMLVQRFKNINKIYSHPQALEQCQSFLRKYFPGVERVDTSSTSRAAEIVKSEVQSGLHQSLAIGSDLAAYATGLDVLHQGCEDRKDNCTRFFLVSRRTGEKSQGSTHVGMARSDDADTRILKSMVSFRLGVQQPGALAQVLAVFGTGNMNLTSINSRPSLVRSFDYTFLVECEGDWPKFSQMIQEAGILDKTELNIGAWRWWGSWPRVNS